MTHKNIRHTVYDRLDHISRLLERLVEQLDTNNSKNNCKCCCDPVSRYDSLPQAADVLRQQELKKRLEDTASLETVLKKLRETRQEDND